MSKEDFDTATCITARELRALGADLEPEIPDCAWAPRKDVGIAWVRPQPETSPLTLKVSITFRSPLRWVSIRGTVHDS